MFQVMIVDDEKAIRENLPAIIDFESHGFKVCATAKNGEDALEKLESFRPDVIFLDVCMPVMDGLTFLGKLQEREANPSIVMLSGYSDFEYARTAIRYGVRAYLTKPVEEEEVEALLEALAAELRERSKRSKKADVQEHVLAVKQMYHNGDGDRTPFGDYRMMHCVVIDDSAIQEESYRIARETIEERLQGGEGAFCRNRGSVLSYLVSPRALEEYQYSVALFGRHLLYRLKKEGLECALLFDEILFARSEGTFRSDYDQHLYQMMTEVFWGGDLLQDNLSLQTEISDRRLEREEEYLEQLKKAMRDRDHLLLLTVYDRLVEAVRASRLNLIFLQEVSHRIYYVLTDLLSAEGNEDLRLAPLDWRNESCFLRFEDWSRQLWEQIDTAFAYVYGQEDVGQGTAMKVASYARQHFREPITLKETAERFFVSPAYLGRSFQKTVGVPFKQYVNDLRIEEARRLLRQTDKLIYEIAEETGFAESKYFVARFTAVVGMSPMEYRKLSENPPKQEQGS